ncbi:MAG TPA: EamA family transporter [Nevskiaceae bacterium]
MSPPVDSGKLLGVGTVVVASLLWGTTGTAATFAPAVGPLAIGASAMGIGGLLQAFHARRALAQSRDVLKAQRRLLALGAVAVAVYPLLFYSSMRLAGVATGTVVSIGSSPPLAALIEWRAGSFRPTLQWAIGVLLGVCGIVLLSLAGTRSPQLVTSASGMAIGAVLALGAGFSYALYTWTARSMMLRGAPRDAAMGATFGLGGLLLVPVLLATGAPFLASWRNLGVGLYMAIVPMYIGYRFFGHGLARISASLATAVSLLEPAVATVLAVTIVHESLSASGWLGIVLVMACLALVTRMRTPPPASPRPPAGRMRP